MVHPHDLWHDPWTIRILELARRLRRKGHAVHLCHLPRKEKPGHPPLRRPLADDPPISELQPRQIQTLSNFRLLYRLAESCDVIHLQKCFAAVALPILWVSRIFHKPVHYDWDDDETAIAEIVERRFLSRLQLSIYEKNLPRFASTLTYSSEAIRRKALASGFPADRLWHLPVGADLDRFSPQCSSPETLTGFGLDPRRLTVLYIGQMEGAAHAHLLIEAAPRVLSQYPEIQFLLVGGGEQLASARQGAERSSARERLFLPGYAAAERIPAIVASADICVACFEDLPATRAKSPLKITEYLASGKPVVASRVGEVPWMIGDCGITVEPGNSDALADGILAYARNPDKRRRDGLEARRRAEALFNWDHGAETLLQAYSIGLQFQGGAQ